MDGERFDHVTRAIFRCVSRRRAIFFAVLRDKLCHFVFATRATIYPWKLVKARKQAQTRAGYGSAGKDCGGMWQGAERRVRRGA